MPRRIAHQEATRTFGLLTCMPFQEKLFGAKEEESDKYHFRVLNDQTFELLASYALKPNECACSLTSCLLGDDPLPYYVVGTAIVLPSEEEPTTGRLLVFEYNASGLHLVCEMEIKGAAYALGAFQGQKLVAAVNNRVWD